MSKYFRNSLLPVLEQIQTDGGAGGGAGGGNPPPDPGDDGGDDDDPGQDPDGQRGKGGGGDDPGGLDFSDPAATKAEIERLRKENAKHRTKAKERDSQYNALNERFTKFETGLKKLFGEEEDNLTPEQRIEALQVQNESLAVQSALKEAAFEYGIGRDQYDYFEFLVNKKLGDLEEGEELTDEDLDAIAQQCKGQKASGSTSVEGGDPPPPGDNDEISLEEFQAMGIGQRSALYQKDKTLYNSLVAKEKAAKTKR